MRTRLGPYSAVPITLPISRSSGMKIHDTSPARAACAATALARLPVDAHPTVSSPNASAALMAVETTRSLNDSEGCDTASFFTHTRATPSLSASRGASISGEKPVSSDATGSPSNGNHSRYRHIDCGRAAIVARSGSLRDAGYSGSSGPRQFSQIATGAASFSVPHSLHRWEYGRSAAARDAPRLGPASGRIEVIA